MRNHDERTTFLDFPLRRRVCRMRFSLDILNQAVQNVFKLNRLFDEIKINQGRILSSQQLSKTPESLAEFEFKVFSQWGEDGILQFLTRNLRLPNRTFIEFGVEDFFESNCRFLMMKDLWQGYVIDGSSANILRLRSSYFYWRYQLQARASFITAENICALLDESGFDKDIGILSIDLDGIDYYVLDRLKDWRPGILIVEYNAIFGANRAVSVPYDARFRRTAGHHSNLYYGASLPAFCHLACGRGYALVGTNSMGSNAFFVRRDLLNKSVREIDPRQGFRDSIFRESRDVQGRLSTLSGADRRTEIGALPLIDVTSGQSLAVADLDR
jgi:hypothetical protein